MFIILSLLLTHVLYSVLSSLLSSYLVMFCVVPSSVVFYVPCRVRGESEREGDGGWIIDGHNRERCGEAEDRRGGDVSTS